MPAPPERLAVLCTLAAIAFLALRLRQCALMAAFVGAVLLVALPDRPPRPRPRPRRWLRPVLRGAYGSGAPEPYVPEREKTAPPMPAAPVPTAAAAAAAAAADPETDDPETETVGTGAHDGELYFTAEHTGAPAGARFQRAPNQQVLTAVRLGNPAGRGAAGGRDRAGRVALSLKQSLYRDTTGQSSRFAHLR
jgi:hypothetical protein